jgi:hypothetical protein
MKRNHYIISYHEVSSFMYYPQTATSSIAEEETTRHEYDGDIGYGGR